jgi:hypothetical protein
MVEWSAAKMALLLVEMMAEMMEIERAAELDKKTVASKAAVSVCALAVLMVVL